MKMKLFASHSILCFSAAVDPPSPQKKEKVYPLWYISASLFRCLSGFYPASPPISPTFLPPFTKLYCFPIYFSIKLTAEGFQKLETSFPKDQSGIFALRYKKLETHTGSLWTHLLISWATAKRGPLWPRDKFWVLTLAAWDSPSRPNNFLHRFIVKIV